MRSNEIFSAVNCPRPDQSGALAFGERIGEAVDSYRPFQAAMGAASS